MFRRPTQAETERRLYLAGWRYGIKVVWGTCDLNTVRYLTEAAVFDHPVGDQWAHGLATALLSSHG